MLLAGIRFSETSVIAVNYVITFPDYPAEIRASAGTLAGVSSFDLSFSSNEIFITANSLGVLVAMNPAALKANLSDLKKGGIVNLDEGVNEKELMIHDQYCDDSVLAKMLSGFDYPDFPVPMGILRQVEYIPYEDKIEQQIKMQIEKKGVGDLAVLLRGNQVWKIWKDFC